MKNFKIEYKFRYLHGVIHRVETPVMELPHDDWYFEHKATVIAMKILLEKPDIIQFQAENKELIDYKIIWEE